MTLYQVGIDLSKLKDEVEKLNLLVRQLYEITEFNINKGKLVEPKQKE